MAGVEEGLGVRWQAVGGMSVLRRVGEDTQVAQGVVLHICTRLDHPEGTASCAKFPYRAV